MLLKSNIYNAPVNVVHVNKMIPFALNKKQKKTNVYKTLTTNNVPILYRSLIIKILQTKLLINILHASKVVKIIKVKIITK